MRTRRWSNTPGRRNPTQDKLKPLNQHIEEGRLNCTQWTPKALCSHKRVDKPAPRNTGNRVAHTHKGTKCWNRTQRRWELRFRIRPEWRRKNCCNPQLHAMASLEPDSNRVGKLLQPTTANCNPNSFYEQSVDAKNLHLIHDRYSNHLPCRQPRRFALKKKW